MRGISPPALFELRAHWWPSAKAGGMPWTRTTLSFQRAHRLANRPGSLVRLTFQIGPRDRTRTLSAVRKDPFRLERNASSLGYTRCWHTDNWCPRSELHRHSTRFKCVASALGYVGCWRRATKLVPREGFAPSTFPF